MLVTHGDTCPGSAPPPSDGAWAQAPINLLPNGYQQTDVPSVWFECLTNDGSTRTVKTKSYLNSLSLLTVSRFIHGSRRQRVKQTRLVWTWAKFLTLPELSDFPP